MPTDLKTDPKLLASLKKAAKHQLTPDEIRRQRVSFVYGNLPVGNTLTKHQVAELVARFEGEAA